MESKERLGYLKIVILTVCVTAIISCIIVSLWPKGNEVSITGSAQKIVKSDLVIWTSRISRREANLAPAYKKLQEDLDTVKKYLAGKGIVENEITVSQACTETLYEKTSDECSSTNKIEAYNLSQVIEVKSSEVDKVTRVSREATELIGSGIQFESYAPKYFFTKLEELRPGLFAEAAKNAKEIAKDTAKSTGNKIGAMRLYEAEVFRVNPVYYSAKDCEGEGEDCETVSQEKRVTAFVSVYFALL